MRMWQRIGGGTLARHSHESPYLALVLAGSFEEAGDLGRFQVRAGHVLLHDGFEAHIDRFGAMGATVLNLPLRLGQSFCPGAGTVADPDLIARHAEKSRMEATEMLLSIIDPCCVRVADWPDKLAADLIRDPSTRLSAWAEEEGLAPWKVSRGFTQVFGISPEAFRARVRARQAWKAIHRTEQPLVQIALQSGFADQAHMTRSVKQVTGMSPRAWRSCK
jgi:AraC-like DNA-binding protein